VKGLLFSPLPKPSYTLKPGEKAAESDEEDKDKSDSDSDSSSGSDGD
jgi:hypothetical protein